MSAMFYGYLGAAQVAAVLAWQLTNAKAPLTSLTELPLTFGIPSFRVSDVCYASKSCKYLQDPVHNFIRLFILSALDGSDPVGKLPIRMSYESAILVQLSRHP
jgi:hypothetical protein